MSAEIVETGPDDLARYSDVPIAFVVDSVLRADVVDSGLGGIVLSESKVDAPYVKDYDAHGDGGPESWPAKFDVRNWGFFLALEGSRVIGAAAVAFDTPGVNMLCGRRDLAVLWDIRVRPERRGGGVGTRLFDHAVRWSRDRGCVQLRAETQDVNARACRFYARRGCQLGHIDRYGYFGHPEVGREAKLIWHLEL
jgi:GNAT superfamily N-acetyltransferase